MSSTELRSEADQNQFILELYAAMYRLKPRRVTKDDWDERVHTAIARCLVAVRRGVITELPDNIDAYAVRVLTRARIDLKRTQTRRDDYDTEHFNDRNGRNPEWMSADRSTDEATNAARQQRALSVLSSNCQRAFYMVRSQGMTYEQVGEALDLSPNTIHTYITRAHRVLREEFRDVEHLLTVSTRGGRPPRKRYAWKKERLSPKYPRPVKTEVREGELAGTGSPQG